jgi:hypothetical protein
LVALQLDQIELPDLRVLSTMQQLRTLRLSRFRGLDRPVQPTDWLLHLSGLRNLRVLEIISHQSDKSASVTLLSLAKLGELLPSLTSLSLNSDGWEMDTEAALALRGVRKLSLSTGAGLASVYEPMQQLTELRFQQKVLCGPFPTLAHLRVLSGPLSADTMTSLPFQLQALHAFESSPTMRAAPALRQLVSTLPNLTSLDLSYASLLTGDDDLVCLGTLTRLRNIFLCESPAGPLTLSALAQGCPALCHLDLSGCSMVTDEAARQLLTCTRLEFLSLSLIDALSDAAVAELALALPGLVRDSSCRLCCAFLFSHVHPSLQRVLIAHLDRVRDLPFDRLASRHVTVHADALQPPSRSVLGPSHDTSDDDLWFDQGPTAAIDAFSMKTDAAYDDRWWDEGWDASDAPSVATTDSESESDVY